MTLSHSITSFPLYITFSILLSLVTILFTFAFNITFTFLFRTCFSKAFTTSNALSLSGNTLFPLSVFYLTPKELNITIAS